jgi:hypothetical protein
MAPDATSPARGATGLENVDCLAAVDDLKTSSPKSETQEAIARLQREFISEALRIAAIKASHAADDLDICDDSAAERSIRIAIQSLKQAATAFRELDQLKQARVS